MLPKQKRAVNLRFINQKNTKKKFKMGYGFTLHNILFISINNNCKRKFNLP